MNDMMLVKIPMTELRAVKMARAKLKFQFKDDNDLVYFILSKGLSNPYTVFLDTEGLNKPSRMIV